MTLTRAVAGTAVALGNAATQLCVIQSLEGQFHAYALTTGDMVASDADASDDATALAAAQVASDVATGVSLYVDASGTWDFMVQGDVTATAACVQWSAFAGTQGAALAQYENGGSSVDGSSPASTDLQGQTDCFLSNLQGDFSDDGNGAAIDDSALTVSSPGGNPAWATATCFDGGSAIAYADFTLDARSGAAIAHLPGPRQALCGLGAVAAMNVYDSSLTVSGANALGNHSLTTVRCFYYAGGR